MGLQQGSLQGCEVVLKVQERTYHWSQCLYIFYQASGLYKSVWKKVFEQECIRVRFLESQAPFLRSLVQYHFPTHVGWNMGFPNTYPQSPETAKLQHKWFPRYPHLHPPIFAFPTLSWMWVHGDRFPCPVTWHTSFPILYQHHTMKPDQSIHWFPTHFNWKPPCIDFTPTISIITPSVLHQIGWGLVHWNLLENAYKMVYNTCSNHQKQQGQLSPYHRFHISQLGNHHQIT